MLQPGGDPALGGGVRRAAVVTAVVPGHRHGGAVRRDRPGVRVGLVEAEQRVPFALHQQGRGGDVADHRGRARPGQQGGQRGGDPAGLRRLRVGSTEVEHHSPAAHRGRGSGQRRIGGGGGARFRRTQPELDAGALLLVPPRRTKPLSPLSPCATPVADSAAPVVTEAIRVEAQNFLNTPSPTPDGRGGCGRGQVLPGWPARSGTAPARGCSR